MRVFVLSWDGLATASSSLIIHFITDLALQFGDMLSCGQPARIQIILSPLCVYRIANSPKQTSSALESPVSPVTSSSLPLC